MLKIIHCADIHLGSKIEAKLPRDKSNERKSEVRSAFKRIVEYAERNGIRVILLAGDVFDSDRPLKKDKEFFYSVVKNNPAIDFLYLRGNHDNRESYTEYNLTNLKTFSDAWTSYDYGDAVISGVEIVPENATSLYSSLKLDKKRKNIVMLHGQYGETSGVDKVNLSKLRNKNVDYLALGHLHSYSAAKLDDNADYVYSGCPEGRGFDELGEKGFVEITVGDKITHRFVPCCQRKIEEYAVDISETTDVYSVYRTVKSKIACTKDDLVRVVLKGEIAYDYDDLAEDIGKYLENDYYFVTVKDKTTRKFNVDDVRDDLSLQGEFIRLTLARADISDECKRQIISTGLKALGGKEIES